MDSPLEIARRLVRADFDDMAAMEARFYGEDVITPAEESWNWYVQKPFSIVAARGADRHVAGFVNLFPVPDAIWRDILAGTFNDADLVAADIVDPWGPGRTGGPLHMFLSCIVVDEAHRGGGLSRALLRAAAAQYADVAHLVDGIAVDTATPAGERLAARYGFVPLCESDHGTRVWSRDYAGFAASLL